MENSEHRKYYYYKAEHKWGFAWFEKSLLEMNDNYYVTYEDLTEEEFRQAIEVYGTEPRLI